MAFSDKALICSREYKGQIAMTSTVRFDDSLPLFIDLIVEEWGLDAVSNNLFLRDPAGKLTFLSIDGKHDGKEREALALKAATILQGYTDTEGFAVATPSELFDDSLSEPKSGWQLTVKTKLFNGNVHLIDRRVVGADWLRSPAPAAAWPPRIAFASLKGGVGRSTALCVLAAHLLKHGLRVLAIDMDLEAPGLGNMLLTDATLPEFGLLDYLVEAGINPIGDDFYVDMIAPSWLGAGQGSISVIPALGRRSVANPENVLAKIARAYLEQLDQMGKQSGITSRMQRLLTYIEDRADYDVILIDARAGLHETTAAAVVGLGAEVLLFGVDQPQTFAGYSILFAHLSTLSGDDWRSRLYFVQAKAPTDQKRRDAFSDKMIDLMNTTLWSYPEITGLIAPEALKGVFELEWTDGISDEELDRISREDGDDSPNPIIAIGESPDFHEFDPANRPDSLLEAYYMSAYGAFLEKVCPLAKISPPILDEVEE